MSKIGIALGLLCVLAVGSLAQAESITFQQGLNGYTGTVDTYVNSTSAGPFGTADAIQLNSSTIRQGLLRFNNFFGSDANQIPSGSSITSATLTIYGHTGSSGGGGKLHRLLSSATTDGWSNATTWTSLDGGINLADTEYVSTQTGSFASAPTSQIPVDITVTADVAAWAAGDANLGWVFFGNTTSQYLCSSEYTASPGKQPKLTVVYLLAGTRLDSFVVKDKDTANPLFTDSAEVAIEMSVFVPEGNTATYQITQEDAEPAEWLDTQPSSYTFDVDTPEGLVTVYGWVKDNTGTVREKSATITYASAGPTVLTSGAYGQTDTTAMVFWTTDVPVAGKVLFRQTGTADFTATDPESSPRTLHVRFMTGLSIGTSYDYVIENDGVARPSALYTHTGAVSEIPKSRMTVTGDVGNATVVVDGNTAGTTVWTASAAATAAEFHCLRVDLGGRYRVQQVGYKGAAANKGFNAYEIYVTDSATGVKADWGSALASGTFDPAAPARENADLAGFGRYIIIRGNGQSSGISVDEIWALGVSLDAVVDTFAVADAASGKTDLTKTGELTVTSFTASPSMTGTSITGYQITESAEVPTEGWAATAPTSCTITGSYETVTLYGWAMDNDGKIGVKKTSITYRDPERTFVFSDCKKANVLREYVKIDAATYKNAVTFTPNIGRDASNDGSGWNDETNIAAGLSVTKTFTLAGFRTVGSFYARFNNTGTPRFLLEGFDGVNWIVLKDVTTPTTDTSGTFTAATLNKIRYTAFNTSGSQITLRLDELEVYLADGQTVSLNSGFNFFRDQVPASTNTATTGGPWTAPNGGNATTLRDGDFRNEVKQQSADPTTRSFVAYAYANALPVRCATFGGNNGQGFKLWEFYTANGPAMPGLQALAAADKDTILAAGWTLQYQQVSAGEVQMVDFAFAQPGDWKYFAMAWNGTAGACSEFSLFNPILKPTLNFAATDTATGSTVLTSSATVNVSFAATPSENGTAIAGYLITETGMPPAEDASWLQTPPPTFAFQAQPGKVNLFGWVKDDAGQVASKAVTMVYRLPGTPLYFGGSAKVNVLRQYDATTGLNMVTSTAFSTGNANWSRSGILIDGSGHNDEASNLKAATDSVGCVFTMPYRRTVGSFMVQLQTRPTSFVIDGSVDKVNWSTLATLSPPSNADNMYNTGIFDEPMEVKYIRYTAVGPSLDDAGGGYVRIFEMQVYDANPGSVNLTDGFNILPDQAASGVLSTTAGPWRAQNGGDINTLKNLRFNDNELKNQTAGSRSFVAYTLSQPVSMKHATLGATKDQRWENGFECYAALADPMPALQSLAAADSATIVAAGWTLQFQTAAAGQVTEMNFAMPGAYNQIALVWNGTGGAEQELEVFGPIVRTAITAFSVADPATGSTVITTSNTVAVAAFTASPSEVGQSISGYAITESDAQPVDWLDAPPSTVTFAAGAGNVTLFAWAKDDTNQVGYRTATILYRPAGTVLTFKNAAKANVLRQYSADTYKNMVTSAYTLTGGAWAERPFAANDGSGWNEESNLTAGCTYTQTFTLPGPRTVGSFMAQFGTASSRWLLEGSLDGETWTTLADLNPASAGITLSGTFDAPAPVKFIRYTAYGPAAPGGDGKFRMYELQVYVDAGQVVGLRDGYSFVVDQNPAGAVSATAGVWSAPNGGDATTLKDARFNDNELKNQNTGRSYVVYSFIEPLPMVCASLGATLGQGWSHFECYTALANQQPPLAGLAANDSDSIVSAGWTLQYKRTDTSAAQLAEMQFAQPGLCSYLLLVWDATWGSEQELEVFAPIRGTAVTAFAVADTTDNSTFMTDDAAVKVAAFTAAPSDLGSMIAGYAINESGLQPADGDWQATAPATYAITGAPGKVTIYGWAKDDAGQAGMKAASIIYRPAGTVLYFNDPTNANVLREYSVDTLANSVTADGVAEGGAGWWRPAGGVIDGGGGNVEGPLPAGGNLITTFTLPGTRTVGSYMVQFQTAPASFILEGSTDGTSWTPLTTIATPADNSRLTGSFDAPAAVNKIRATAVGPAQGDGIYRVFELQVYLAAGETAALTSGFSYFRDQNPAGIVSQASGVWKAPNGGDAVTLKDAKFNDSELKCQAAEYPSTDRAFVAYSFVQPVPMVVASLGATKDQGWGAFECYTALSETMPPLQSLAGTDPETIKAAGWTLQYQRIDTASIQAVNMPFASPGNYNQLVLVWTATQGSEQEFELYGVEAGNPPPVVTAFAVADQSTGSRLFTNSSTVNVTSLAAEPKGGKAIAGYMITETNAQPAAGDAGWAASLTTCTIAGAEGTVTLYAWAKDSADVVSNAGLPAAILFSTATPAVSNIVITDNKNDTATAAWDTDIAAEGALQYGPVKMSGATPTVVPENAAGTSHSVTFSTAAGTNYKIVLVNNEKLWSPATFWPSMWPIPGDVTKDCRVNILDLIFIRNRLNQPVTTGDNIFADVTKDAKINILDLIAVRNKLNTVCP